MSDKAQAKQSVRVVKGGGKEKRVPAKPPMREVLLQKRRVLLQRVARIERRLANEHTG